MIASLFIAPIFTVGVKGLFYSGLFVVPQAR